MALQVGGEGSPVKLCGDRCRAGAVQEMKPALCEPTVGEQVVGKTRMGIHMIRVDCEGTAVMNGRPGVVAPVADRISDIA